MDLTPDYTRISAFQQNPEVRYDYRTWNSGKATTKALRRGLQNYQELAGFMAQWNQDLPDLENPNPYQLADLNPNAEVPPIQEDEGLFSMAKLEEIPLDDNRGPVPLDDQYSGTWQEYWDGIKDVYIGNLPEDAQRAFLSNPQNSQLLQNYFWTFYDKHREK